MSRFFNLPEIDHSAASRNALAATARPLPPVVLRSNAYNLLFINKIILLIEYDHHSTKS